MSKELKGPVKASRPDWENTGVRTSSLEISTKSRGDRGQKITFTPNPVVVNPGDTEINGEVTVKMSGAGTVRISLASALRRTFVETWPPLARSRLGNTVETRCAQSTRDDTPPPDKTRGQAPAR